MKKWFILICLIIPVFSFGQLKKDTKTPDFSSILTQPQSNFMGFLDLSKIQMNHSFSVSFGSFGGGQTLQNAYMNTMNIQISENLFLTTNLGILSTPYHTFGENSFLNDPQFFGGAELNYKISDKSSLMLRFESVPYNYYSPYSYNRYYSPFSNFSRPFVE